jgi:hypothetical protein
LTCCASGLDTHRDSISSRFACRSLAGAAGGPLQPQLRRQLLGSIRQGCQWSHMWCAGLLRAGERGRQQRRSRVRLPKHSTILKQLESIVLDAKLLVHRFFFLVTVSRVGPPACDTLVYRLLVEFCHRQRSVTQYYTERMHARCLRCDPTLDTSTWRCVFAQSIQCISAPQILCLRRRTATYALHSGHLLPLGLC